MDNALIVFEIYKNELFSNIQSKSTAEAYVRDLKQYMEYFCQSFDKYPDVNNLLHENIIEYISFLKTVKRNAPATINRKVSSLSVFNMWLIQNKYMSQKFIGKKDYIKIQRIVASPLHFTEKDIKKITQSILESKDKRLVAMTYILQSTGCRASEVCSILLYNLDLQNKEVLMNSKGNKFKKVFLNSKALASIEEYLKVREEMKYKDSPYLFITQKGPKLTRNTLYRYIKANAVKVGCQDFRVHDFKHFFISICLEKNIFSIPELMSITGNSSSRVFERYMHPSTAHIKSQIEKL